jgi:hypothetical protein
VVGCDHAIADCSWHGRCSILLVIFRQHYLLFTTFQWIVYVFFVNESSLSIRFNSLLILTSYPQVLGQCGCHKPKLHQFYMIIFGRSF